MASYYNSVAQAYAPASPIAPVPVMPAVAVPVAVQQVIVNVGPAAPREPGRQSVLAPPTESTGPVEQSLRDQFPGHAHLWSEQELMVKIAEAFDMLDTNDDKKIQRDEFKKAIARLQIHDPKGSAEGWKDGTAAINRRDLHLCACADLFCSMHARPDVFNKFDVDGKGEVEYAPTAAPCHAYLQRALSEARGALARRLQLHRVLLRGRSDGVCERRHGARGERDRLAEGGDQRDATGAD
jgi:hypothetical protein